MGKMIENNVTKKSKKIESPDIQKVGIFIYFLL